MEDLDLPHKVSLEIVYVDEHLMELEAAVNTGCWRGQARVYAVPQDHGTFAVELQHFCDAKVATAEFTAGADNGMGLIALRFNRIDRAGHMACYARLASRRLHRTEQVSRLGVVFGAETWAILRFARQLTELSCKGSGRALWRSILMLSDNRSAEMTWSYRRQKRLRPLAFLCVIGGKTP